MNWTNPTSRNKVTCIGEITRLFLIVTIVIAGMFFKSEANEVSMASIDASETKGNIEDCVITLLDAYIWRNWMPFLESPEPDGGSPLHISVRLRFDNSKGKTTKLSLSAVVLGEDNMQYPVVFDAVRDKHENLWDGTVAGGDNKNIEMLAKGGPPLRVGTKSSLLMTFTNRVGAKVSLKTPELIIERAD